LVNYEKKHLYMMGAIAVLILTPFYILVGPFIFQGIMFDDVSVWLLQTPMTAYGLYGISALMLRSEERRVGKECRSRWSPYH